jgi:Protein of unknown function (DUF935)
VAVKRRVINDDKGKKSSSKPNVVPLTARTTQAWGYESIRRALDDQKLGNFDRICSLHTSLLGDESYSAALNKRINALIRSDLSFEAYDVNEPGAQVAVDLCTRYSSVMMDESELQAALTDFGGEKLFFGKVDVKAVDGLLLPCFRHLNPINLRFDQQEQRWIYRSAHGDMTVTPGDGCWVLITSWRPGYPVGFVSQLAEVWAYGTVAIRSWVDWCDNSGFPITKLKTPIDGDADQRAQFVNDVATLQQRKVIETPQDKDGNGYDVEVIASTAAEGYAGLKELVEWKRLMFQIAILGGNLSSEISDVGSHAAAETHMGVQRELVASDARLISSGLREQLLRVAVEWNVGSFVEPPLMCWDVSPPQDPKARMEAINSFAQFLTTMASTGYIVDNVVELAESVGLQISAKPGLT